jgi:hypothetical protein
MAHEHDAGSTTWFSVSCASSSRCTQNPSRPASWITAIPTGPRMAASAFDRRRPRSSASPLPAGGRELRHLLGSGGKHGQQPGLMAQFQRRAEHRFSRCDVGRGMIGPNSGMTHRVPPCDAIDDRPRVSIAPEPIVLSWNLYVVLSRYANLGPRLRPVLTACRGRRSLATFAVRNHDRTGSSATVSQPRRCRPFGLTPPVCRVRIGREWSGSGA